MNFRHLLSCDTEEAKKENCENTEWEEKPLPETLNFIMRAGSQTFRDVN